MNRLQTKTLAIPLLALCLAGCKKPEYQNVLLITVDGLRADAPGCYGGAAATPNLDRLAQEGVRFEKLLTPVPLTLPAHASLLTGMNPPEHGLRIDAFGRLPPSIATLAESFAAVGFQTAAFLTSPRLAPIHGLDRGFGVYHAPVPEAAHAILFHAPLSLTPGASAGPGAALPPPFPDHTDAASGTRFRSWFAALAPETPWFAWVQFSGTTLPRTDASGAPLSATDTNGYLRAVTAVDAEIGAVLAALDAAPGAAKTLVLVTASSGESLGDNGEFGHGLLLRAATRRVPGLLRLPDRRSAGSRIAVSVGLVQVAPTLLDLAGVPPVQTQAANWSFLRWLDSPRPVPVPSTPEKTFLPSRADSLAPLLLGYTAGTDAAVYCETEFPFSFLRWRPLTAFQSGNWVYIANDPPELYDVDADPYEQTNLAVSLSDSVERMDIRLERIQAAMSVRPPVDTTLSNTVWQTLAQWGHTGRTGNQTKNVYARPRIGLSLQEREEVRPPPDAALAAAVARLHPLLSDTNRSERLLQLVESCIARSPQTARFYLWRAALNAADTNALQSVIADLTRASACDPDDAETAAQLGRAHADAGDWREALKRLRDARRIDPRNATASELLPKVLVTAANAAAQAEELSEALQMVEELITFQPTLDNRMWRVRLLVSRQRNTQAKQELRNILYANPDYFAARDMLEKMR